jgi:hypothetical protein
MCRRPFSDAVLLFVAGCSSSTGGGTASRDAGLLDASAVDDGGSAEAAELEAGTPPDGASPDAGPAGDAGGVTYSTHFPLTENPISEGGHWIHLGTPWCVVATGGGVAYGTQPGDGAYTDSYAHLSGFPPDQSVTVTIHLEAGLSPGGTREAEIHLRWADSASSARGYECNLAYNGAYAEVVRWNGALGDYTYVSPQGSGGPGAVHDGDVFQAEIVGTVITTSLNGHQLQHVDVSSIGGTVWSDGDPGMGFWRGAGASATPGDYGFGSYAATSLP